jgi:hypothetical protein
VQGTGFSRSVSTIGIGVLVVGGIVVYKLLDHNDSSYPEPRFVTERELGLIRSEAHNVQDRTAIEKQGWVETTYDRTETNLSPLPKRAVRNVANWARKAGRRLEKPLRSRGLKPSITPQITGHNATNRGMPAPHYWKPTWSGQAISPGQFYHTLPNYPHYNLAPPNSHYNQPIRPRKPRWNMCVFMGFD